MGKLPSEYIELSYIESTGTQYIDTGFKPNHNTRVTCCFSTSASNTSIFGAQSARGTTSISFGGNTVSFGYYGNTALTLNDGISHKIDFDKGNLTVDGTALCSASGTF